MRVEFLHQRRIAVKVRGSPIVLSKAFEVLFGPILSWVNSHLVNRNVFFHNALGHDRYGEPLTAAWCFNAIAVSPAMLIILNVVVKYEHIRLINLMEIAPPRDVGWLQNDAVHLSVVFLNFDGKPLEVVMKQPHIQNIDSPAIEPEFVPENSF